MFIHRLCGGRRKDQSITRCVAVISREATKQGIADSDAALLVVLRFKTKLRPESNRDRFVLPIHVHPLRYGGFANTETGPGEKTDESFLEGVRHLGYRGDFLLGIGCIFLVLVSFVHVDRPVFHDARLRNSCKKSSMSSRPISSKYCFLQVATN